MSAPVPCKFYVRVGDFAMVRFEALPEAEKTLERSVRLKIQKNELADVIAKGRTCVLEQTGSPSRDGIVVEKQEIHGHLLVTCKVG